MSLVDEKFEKMGARIKLGRMTPNRFNSNPVDVNIREDKKGQYYTINVADGVDLSILDLDPKDRHLVLMAKIPGEQKHQPPEKVKFLCGHDEREWFSCQLANRSVTTVSDAKLALQPKEVRKAQKGMKKKERLKRHTSNTHRQGEWFFIPFDLKEPDEELIHHKEPLMVGNARAGSKPHIAQFAYRRGGERVNVVNGSRWPVVPLSQEDQDRLGNGLTDDEKRIFILRYPDTKKWAWTPMVRDPELFVKGTIRHPDHATLELQDWHQVFMNVEERGRFSSFLD